MTREALLMKKIFTLFLVCAAVSASADFWTQKATFPSQGRQIPFSFSIGTKGYMGTGRNGTCLVDFWEYDPSLNVWTQKANFPGTGRFMAAGMGIAGKGYAGLGTDCSYASLSDWWQYDPGANTWTAKANCPVARGYPAWFVIGNYGYLCGGHIHSWATMFNDLYRYDAIADVWVQKASLPGSIRADANGFSIGDKGYIEHFEAAKP